MIKIYVFAGIMLAMIGAYWAGGRIAAEKSRAGCLAATMVANADLQNKIIETKEKINAETYNAGVADIRIWLYEKYTVQD